MERLSGKVVLITGGTSGIGRACAELMAREGAKVIAMSIQQAEGHELQRQLADEGGNAFFSTVTRAARRTFRAPSG